MARCVISGTGLWTPAHQVSNAALVHAFNQYVDLYNVQHQAQIDQGLIEPLQYSSASFIEAASGIQSRYFFNAEGILNPEIMRPLIPVCAPEDPCHMVQMALKAGAQALACAQVSAQSVDLVIVAASNMERAYPAISIELQHYLGCTGMAFDMNVACSSAIFALHAACSLIESAGVRTALIVNPEICSAHLNFCDRDSHFIFGDACTATVVQQASDCVSSQAFEICSRKCTTHFSRNIRNDAGFLNRCSPDAIAPHMLLFQQSGRRVFRELLPLAVKHLGEHLQENKIRASDVKRFWLHQANQTMNQFAVKKLLGREALPEEAPLILHQYANTSSAGCMIAFHQHHQDLNTGDFGLLSAFGAGYSIGSLLLRKC